MNENERSALAAYRTSLGAKQPEQARDWSRLLSKIEAGAQPLSVDLEPPRRRRWAAWGLGAAAAVLLAAWAWPKFEAAQGEDRTGASAAAYGVEERASSEMARPKPEPVRRVESKSGATVSDAPVPNHEAAPETNPTPDPAVDPEPSATPAPKPESPARRAPRPDSGTESVAEASEAQDVVAEAKALRAIRVSLRDQQADQALRLLRRYLSRFPQGVLRDEATLLRADALCMDGQRDKARAVATRFVRTHPQSPLTARARDVCLEP